MKWFRVFSEIKDDPKMLELDYDQRWLWVCLLAMASESDERGTITYPGMRGLAASLRTNEERLVESLQAFATLQMIDADEGSITILHWDDRQYDKPSDVPEATRGRKSRSRARHAESRDGHATDTEADTDTDSEPDEPAAAPEDEAIDLSDDEREVVTAIRRVRGMGCITEREIALHLRSVLAARASPVSAAALKLDALNFEEYWQPRRATAPPNKRWVGWRKAVTNWFSRTTELPRPIASGPMQQRLGDSALDDRAERNRQQVAALNALDADAPPGETLAERTARRRAALQRMEAHA